MLHNSDFCVPLCKVLDLATRRINCLLGLMNARGLLVVDGWLTRVWSWIDGIRAHRSGSPVFLGRNFSLRECDLVFGQILNDQ